MTIIYYHVMYKNELNQQNKGDETNEKFCIPKPFITDIYEYKPKTQ